MNQLLQNLAHFTHGMSLMFFVMMSIQLHAYRKQNRILRILYGLMLFWVFIQLKDLTYLLDGVWSNVYVSTIHLSIDMWCVPAIIILLFEVISPGWVNSRRVLLVFLPSVLLTAGYIFTSYIIFYQILVYYSNGIGALALFIVLFATSRHERFIKRNFSDIDNININIKWVRHLIIVLYLLLLAWTFIHKKSTWAGDIVFYLFQIAMWMSFYYYARKHNVVHSPPLSELISLRKEKRIIEEQDVNNSKSESSERFISDLKKIMEDERVFLNPNLNITTLASHIGTNRTYLSDCLNNIMNISFYDYVNSFRVKEACRLLGETEHKTLEELSELCGFNSISTFRRAFVKQMKQNPIEYKKNCLEKLKSLS